MKASVIASLALGAATVSAGNYTTSTMYTTSVYTVTSCAPTVTDCPSKMGSVTTDIISLYTTVCPVTATLPTPVKADSASMSKETPYTTSTVKITKEYAITACPATVTDCPVGSKTYTIITSTTVCPVTETEPAPPLMKTDTGVASPPPAKDTGMLSTITYSTCVPTTITSVVTVYPSASASSPASSAPRVVDKPVSQPSAERYHELTC